MQTDAEVSSQLDSMAKMQILISKKFSNVQQRYAVQECDARMFNRIPNACPKKIYNIIFCMVSPPAGRGGGLYLLLIAATGSILAARLAGMMPAKIPTATQIIIVVISMGKEI